MLVGEELGETSLEGADGGDEGEGEEGVGLDDQAVGGEVDVVGEIHRGDEVDEGEGEKHGDEDEEVGEGGDADGTAIVEA